MAGDFGDDRREPASVWTYFIVDTEHWLVKVGLPRRHNLIFWGVTEGHILSERKIHALWATARRRHPVDHAGQTEWFDMEDAVVSLSLSLIGAGRTAGYDEVDDPETLGDEL